MYVGDWVERIARLEPGREAVRIDETGEKISYGRLSERILSAEAWLREDHGVGLGDRVAVLARNRVEFLDLFFACARLGAIMVPLNWRLSADEVGFVMGHSEPRLLVEEGDLAPLVAATGATRVGLPAEGGPWLGRAGEAGRDLAEAADDLALMILYTSGTTGRPKGAVLTHGSVHANSVQTSLSWDLSGSDSTLTHAPFFHAGGWHVLTTPLLHRGGRMVLARNFDATRTLDLIASDRLTLLFAVPTMFEMMRESPRFATADLGSLRFAISGGAPCPEGVSRAFLERGVRFKQGYGLTEAGPNCFAISLADAAKWPASVGFPIHGVRIRVVDGEGKDAPRGEVGELLLRGPHVFSGYWKDPGATAKTLKDGWLHTGDLVRQDPEGRVSIVGRSKEMFISGGENVYPAEIERVLLTHPKVKSAAVVAMPHPKWGEVGRAFLVVEGGELPTSELEEHCRAALARYKVPKRFEVLPAMPLTASGKIAKEELRKRPVE